MTPDDETLERRIVAWHARGQGPVPQEIIALAMHRARSERSRACRALLRQLADGLLSALRRERGRRHPMRPGGGGSASGARRPGPPNHGLEKGALS